MTPLADDLVELLELEHSPVAITFSDQPAGGENRPEPEPAGCCFWSFAESGPIETDAADHANCSVGSYTHGLLPLADAASAEDTAALLDSGWVSEADLLAAPAVSSGPTSIKYEPLASAQLADVILLRLSPRSLMVLQGACPDVALVNKPQCQIVPLAVDGTVAVSPGCAVSRVRTGLPAGELTCALPVGRLEEVVAELSRSRASDAAVEAFAEQDIREHFSPA
jgi:uncharacterized protein (DUF169 family)